MAELRLPRALQSGIALYRRMAGAGGGPACPSGPRHSSPIPGRGAQRDRLGAHARGRGLARLGIGALALLLGAAAAQAQVAAAAAPAQILSTRIWPAKDYTRVT